MTPVKGKQSLHVQMLLLSVLISGYLMSTSNGQNTSTQVMTTTYTELETVEIVVTTTPMNNMTTETDPCSPSPCMNGTCESNGSAYTCSCTPGFTGDNCDTDLCEERCQNGGTCNRYDGFANCTCASGYTGLNCSEDINECASMPCGNGATCTDEVNGYTCTCVPGYTGTDCETDLCEELACQNGGTCNAYDGFANCSCVSGYTGMNCSKDIDECESNPCQNEGTCTDLVDGYNCSCADGFNGTNCETGCTRGTYGSYCSQTCTCVIKANCSNVDGLCTCEEAFNGATCDKANLTVEASWTEQAVREGDNFTLSCQVNLADKDLVEVAWYLTNDQGDKMLPNTTNDKYQVVNAPGRGEYNITIINAGPTDSGTYHCEAEVDVGTPQRNVSNEITVDVLVTGRIVPDASILESEVQLNGTALLNCTVFSSSMNTSITWQRYGEELSSGDRVTINQPTAQPADGDYFYFSSDLTITNVVRDDNGTYECIANDTAEEEQTDSLDFYIVVQEIPELANATYITVGSEELQLGWDIAFLGNAEISCTATYGIAGSDDMNNVTFTTSTSGNIKGLTPYTNYSVSVTCSNEVGASEPLPFPDQRTEPGQPDPPENVTTSDIGQRQVVVSWDAPVLKNGPIDGYFIEASTDIELFISKGFSHQATSQTLEGLVPGTNFTIRVKAYNGVIVGKRQFSKLSDPSPPFTTLEDVPGPPGSLTIAAPDENCKLTWTPPADPNGVIIKYKVKGDIFRVDNKKKDGSLEMSEVGGSTFTYTYLKDDLARYSTFRFSVFAVTSAGDGQARNSSDGTCETPSGTPEVPPSLPSPAEEHISQTSFTIMLDSFEYDERNGPVSCYEVIVVRLKEADVVLDSNSSDYHIDRIGSYDDVNNDYGKPYRAMVFATRPTDNMLVIGAESEKTTCHTGTGESSRIRRSKRSTTRAGNLTATNGPLAPRGIYSSFVRVYTPSDDVNEVFFESGPFMLPVQLNPADPNTPAIVGGIFGAVIAICLIVVIFMLIQRRKTFDEEDRPIHLENNRPVENGGSSSMGMVNLADEIVVQPIKLENLEKEVRRKGQEEKRIFWAEYKSLPNRPPPMVTMNHSNLPANKDKNRYINIIAYDHTRVKLRPIDGIEGSDYINASYVNGYESPDKFIAAQGPKDNTLDDFWRMVWEQGCSTIVMLTKCVEDGKDKCSQYWPDKGTITYGNLRVTMDTTKHTAEYVIRSFFINEEGNENKPRNITQFHFLGWPDHGQPDYAYPMLCLIKRVRHLTSRMNQRANMVVHCSAGVGRTGTYIVIDAMMDKIKSEKQVDIYNFIHEIRQQRNTLVQSFVQYYFIHMALLEEHLFGHTDIAVTEVSAYYQQLSKKSEVDENLSNLELEFRRAARLPVNKPEQSFANIEENKDKNRIGHILPYDKNIVKLERLIGQQYSDYINASYITGYERKAMYIATQGPLPNTVADFWRMVWESQTSTIVMLTEISQRGHEMCAQYWPEEPEEPMEQGDITITLKEEADEGEFTIRDIDITHAHMMQNIYGNVDDEPNSSDNSETALYGNIDNGPASPTSMKDVRHIRQYHYRGWPEVGVPESGLDLVHLANKVHLHQSERGAYPIVVHCSAGSGRTGVFLTLSYLMSRSEEESMVDVFQTVRALRQQRPHMVQDLAQYKFCYSAIVEYIESQSNEYQNFMPRN